MRGRLTRVAHQIQLWMYIALIVVGAWVAWRYRGPRTPADRSPLKRWHGMWRIWFGCAALVGTIDSYGGWSTIVVRVGAGAFICWGIVTLLKVQRMQAAAGD